MRRIPNSFIKRHSPVDEKDSMARLRSSVASPFFIAGAEKLGNIGGSGSGSGLNGTTTLVFSDVCTFSSLEGIPYPMPEGFYTFVLGKTQARYGDPGSETTLGIELYGTWHCSMSAAEEFFIIDQGIDAYVNQGVPIVSVSLKLFPPLNVSSPIPQNSTWKITGTINI